MVNVMATADPLDALDNLIKGLKDENRRLVADNTALSETVIRVSAQRDDLVESFRSMINYASKVVSVFENVEPKSIAMAAPTASITNEGGPGPRNDWLSNPERMEQIAVLLSDPNRPTYEVIAKQLSEQWNMRINKNMIKGLAVRLRSQGRLPT